MSYLICIYDCKECMCIEESFIITCFQTNSGNVQLQVKARGGGGRGDCHMKKTGKRYIDHVLWAWIKIFVDH